jgi:Glycosyl hydrolases related to GH101 family, GH129
MKEAMRYALITFLVAFPVVSTVHGAMAPEEREIALAEVQANPVSFRFEVGESGEFTWWLPPEADEFVLPISAGLVVDTKDDDRMVWFRRGSPWSLLQLPAFGVRYGERMVVAIVPWPHYAELVVEKRIGVRFSFPSGRQNATPCELVAFWRGKDPMEVARAFRDWRQTSANTGAIPRPRPLCEKAEQLPNVSRLFGAPHFYLWGPALISRHDLDRAKWTPFCRALRDAPAESLAGHVFARFTEDQRKAVREMAEADFPMNHLTTQIAAGLERNLIDRTLLKLPAETPLVEVVRQNRKAIAAAFSEFVRDPARWGDGASLPMLDALHDAGIERAVVLLSDFYGHSPRPDVAARANELGFLIGPYDSYHSVHSPDAEADSTWETAQFDKAAYDHGRVLKADGSGHEGFRGVGFQFSPIAAWPYVKDRVGFCMSQAAFSTWFIDCDATAECFDDYNPRHEATRVDDIRARRQRLRWIESEYRLVLGSEDGSALFSDVIHFGHGVQTPWVGHLAPAFRDRQSPHFLGRHWPPDTPEQYFKPVPIVSSLVTPYFDPRVRIPLYQAALGDELVVSHHWSFDSLKFSDIAMSRELLEILYMVPPLYHLNREAWPKRREQIARHVAFWSPLHRELATARLTQFEWLSEDRLLQRTTFQRPAGDVTITVNFGDDVLSGHPAHSATISGAIELRQKVYQAHGSQ